MKILVIQTAFIGDVILATSLLEKLHQFYPDAHIDILVRKGVESLFTGHPFIKHVLVLDKKASKGATLSRLIIQVRRAKYNKVINLHRFSSTGLITMLSNAKEKIGFDKNPFSFSYTKKIKHVIGNGKHEIDRNLELIDCITDRGTRTMPKLYPGNSDCESVVQYKKGSYICLAPSSVWFTKQFPYLKWIEFINKLNGKYTVYLLGATSDHALCESILKETQGQHVVNLSGKLSFLQSAALMKDAVMNYVNDSAPMHIASAMNAPVTAVYCSTVPAFGFGPLADESFIVEVEEKLSCRPCGLHGYKVCPEGHFNCANHINTERLVKILG